MTKTAETPVNGNGTAAKNKTDGEIVNLVQKKPTTNFPTLSPADACAHGLAKYPNNPVLRAVNAAFWTTMGAIDKPHWRPQHVVLRIVGLSGIGKTGMLKDYCQREGLWYHKLDCQVNDVAEIFGLKKDKEILDEKGKVVGYETVSAFPDWWPKEGTIGIINVDDLSRGAPHVQQAMQQFLLEREFNGVKLPDTIALMVTDNPDDGNHHVSSLDDAQQTRFLSIPWNPLPGIEFEQMERQNVHDDCKNFFMLHEERCKIEKPVVLDPPYNNARLRMIFMRIYPFIKDDMELFNLIAGSCFGQEFVAVFRQFRDSEPPLNPEDILAGKPFEETLTRWIDNNETPLIATSAHRLLYHMKNKTRFTQEEWQRVSTFLQLVPKDTGSLMVHEMTDEKTDFGLRMVMFLTRDNKVKERYVEFITSVLKQLEQ